MDGDTRGLASRVADRLGNPPRRLLLLGGGAAVLAVLVDAGLRLDLPQPPPPVPTRRPAPDEDLVLSVVADLTGVIDDESALVSAGTANGTVKRLRAVHREQRAVLVGRLTNDGVPTQVIEAAVRAERSGSGAVATRSGLARRLADVPPERWGEIAAATSANRALLADVYAVRLAGAIQLGQQLHLPEAPSPARPSLAARTQPLVYAFEVVAAQSAGSARRQATDTLAGLNRLDVAVSGTSPSIPSGWSLPYPVTSTDEAEQLAHDTLSAAVTASGELVAPATTAGAVEDVATWSARVQALAVPWDVPITAFPGAQA